MPSPSGRRSALALLVIALGLLFLADNLGLLRLSLGAIWPLFIVWFGLAIVWRLFRWFSWVRLVVAVMLVAFGTALSLHNAGIPLEGVGGIGRPWDVFRLGWPLFLIAWGLDRLTGRARSCWPGACGCAGSPWHGRRGWMRWMGWSKPKVPVETGSAAGDDQPPPSLEWEDHSQMFGDLRFGHGWTLRNASISLMFGDLDIDLSQARVEPGSYQLEISLVAGDVDIYVPADVEVRVEAEAHAGLLRAFSEERSGVSPTLVYESPGYAAAAKRVLIRAHLMAGDFLVARAG